MISGTRIRARDSFPKSLAGTNSRAALVLGNLLVAVLVLICQTASAQTEAENRAAARALALDGVSLAQAGDCEAAIDRFARAERLFHAPTILLGLGECQCKLGLLVEGTENLNKVARENLGNDPPEPFVEAQAKARTLLSEYLPKVAKLTLVVRAPNDAPYVARIDGAELPDAMIGAPRPINPGEHEIVVEGEAFLPSTTTIRLAEGEAQTAEVNLELRPTPEAVLPPPPPPPPDPDPDTTQSPDRLPAYIAFGVGAAGLAAGTIFGLSAARTKSDLEGVCTEGRCPPSAQDDVDSMQSNATLSTVGFGVGLVAAGAGVYLWVTAEPPGSDESGVGSASGAGVRAYLGLDQLGLSGEF